MSIPRKRLCLATALGLGAYALLKIPELFGRGMFLNAYFLKCKVPFDSY